MDNDNHKKTWDNFTKFVLWGTVAVILVLVFWQYFFYKMIVGSISENVNKKKELQSHQIL